MRDMNSKYVTCDVTLVILNSKGNQKDSWIGRISLFFPRKGVNTFLTDYILKILIRYARAKAACIRFVVRAY